MNEINVSLRELIAECIRKIRFIVIFTIFFMIVIGIYGYCKKATQVNNGELVQENKVEEKTTAEKIKELSKEDYDNMMSYVMTIQQERQEKKYVNDSIVMSINPYSVDTVNIQYMISDDDISVAQNAKKLLVNYITDGSLAKKISDDWDELSEEDVNELIYCSQDSDSTNEKINVSSIVCVNIYGENETQVKELETLVEKNINEYVEQISVSDKVSLINSLYHVAKSDELIQFKKNIISDSVRWNDTVASSSANINDSLKTIANELLSENNKNESSEDKSIDTSVVNSQISIIKYFLIGAVLGMVISIAFICIEYILNGKVKTNVDLNQRLEIFDFGNLSKFRNKKIDVLADKFCYGNRLQKTFEDKTVLVSNIISVCKNNNIDNIFLIGNLNSENKDLINELVSELEKKGVNASFEGDILSDHLATDKIEKFDNVILIEVLRKSRYEDVIREINICDKIKCNMLGYITIS